MFISEGLIGQASISTATSSDPILATGKFLSNLEIEIC